MRVFALAACGCSVACVVSDALLSSDKHDAFSDEPTALRATAMVLVVLGSSPSIFNNSLALVVHRGVTLGALVVVSALGMQRAREAQRVVDVLYVTVGLVVAFVASTGDPLKDTGDRDVHENRRDGPLLRKTSALFAATVGLYASSREVRRCIYNAREAAEFQVLLNDGFLARGAAHSPSFVWFNAGANALAACACFSVVVARGARTASLVVALAMVVQILAAFNQMFVFTEIITIYPSIMGSTVDSLTDVQAETIAQAMRATPVGVTFVSAFGLLLLYRSLLEPIREGDDVGQRLLAEGWMWLATPIAALCGSGLAVWWLLEANQDHFWVEVSVIFALLLNEFRPLLTIQVTLFLEGVLFCVYVVLARYYYEPRAFDHLTYWMVLAVGICAVFGGLFGMLAWCAKRKQTMVALHDAAACCAASLATALLLGFSLMLNVCDGRALVAFVEGITLSPSRNALHQVMLHYVPILAVYPALWDRTYSKKRPSPMYMGVFWSVPPLLLLAAYITTGESGGLSTYGTAYGLAKESRVGLAAIPGAVLVPWALVGYAFAYVGTSRDD